MLNVTAVNVDPFDLLLNPESVVYAMEHSERLAHLRRRIYRPLDKPVHESRNAGSDKVKARWLDDVEYLRSL